MSLRKKILKKLDVYYHSDTSTKQVFKDLARRGRLDMKSVADILCLIVEEFEKLEKED